MKPIYFLMTPVQPQIYEFSFNTFLPSTYYFLIYVENCVDGHF